MTEIPDNPYDLGALRKDNDFSEVVPRKKKTSLTKIIQEWLNRRTVLIVPHLNYELSFISPPIGPGRYKKVANLIHQTELAKPTAAETISLCYEAYQKGQSEFLEVRDILKNKMSWLDLLRFLSPVPLPPSSKSYLLLWMFTGNLYSPRGGAYIQDDPPIINKRISMTKSELVKKLELSDTSVRFISPGYKTGELTPSEIAKHPYIKGLATQEGAEKLAELVKDHFKEFHLLGPRNFDNEIVRVSALRSRFKKLYLDCACFGWAPGYAFGIDKPARQTRQERTTC